MRKLIDMMPYDPRKGREQYCARIKSVIENVENRIKRRANDLRTNPENLPETAPGDDKWPSLSKRGHRRLINQDKQFLGAMYGAFLSNCTSGPLPANLPVQEPLPDYVFEKGPQTLPVASGPKPVPIVPIIPDMPIPSIPPIWIPTFPIPTPPPIIVPVFP